MKLKLKKKVTDKANAPVKPVEKTEPKYDGYVIMAEDGGTPEYYHGKWVEDLNDATMFCVRDNAQAKCDKLAEQEGYSTAKVVPVRKTLELVEE